MLLESWWQLRLNTFLLFVKATKKKWRRIQIQSVFKTSVSQPFFDSRHPYLVLKIFGGTLASLIRIMIKEFLHLSAPLPLSHGTLMCRGTPVGNHCFRLWLNHQTMCHLNSDRDAISDILYYSWKLNKQTWKNSDWNIFRPSFKFQLQK